MEILQGIPSYIILLGIIGVATTQAVILVRLNTIEKTLGNGINKKIDNLDDRLDSVEKNCIAHHGIIA